MPQHHSAAEETGMHQDWLRVLDEHQVRFPVLDCDSDSGLLNLLGSQPGWKADFEDREVALFVRLDAAQPHNSLPQAHEEA